MRHAIRTLEVPPGRAGAFAVIPAASPTASSNGANLIQGSPGSTPIRAPRPAAMVDSSWGGQWQGSSNGPEWILPSWYVALPGGDWKHRTRRSESPVPSGRAGQPIASGMRQPVNLGLSVTPSVRPFIRWPVVGG